MPEERAKLYGVVTIELTLTQGQVALIDECDGDLAAFNWHARKDPTRADFPYYAGRAEPGNPKRSTLQLHRVILARMLGRELVEGEVVDHVSGDGLDNRRSNLRLANTSQNAANKRTRRTNTSGFKGVSLVRATGKWRAQIRVNRKDKTLGRWHDISIAARAYDQAAIELFGEFAVTNYPQPDKV